MPAFIVFILIALGLVLLCCLRRPRRPRDTQGYTPGEDARQSGPGPSSEWAGSKLDPRFKVDLPVKVPGS